MNLNKKVLIVEDDPFIAMDLNQTLEDIGYQIVKTVDSGEEAITCAAALSPDIILMDIGLRGSLDGIESARIISSCCSVPVVFLTVDEDEQTLQRAKLVLPFGYLIKPFNARELHSIIEVTLHRRSQEDEPPEAYADAHSIGDRPFADLPDQDDLNVNSQLARRALLSRLSLFQSLSRSELEHFADLTAIRRYDAGEYVVHEGSEPLGGFVVVSGRISVMKTSVAGKELIVSLLPPGSTFGLLYTLDGFSGSSSACCQIESRILWVPTTALHALLAQHPEVSQKFTEELARYVALSHQLCSSLAHSKVEQRIIAALFALLPQFGKGGSPLNQGRIYITRRELADLVGTTPETAIRVTKALERSDLLDLRRPGIIKMLDLQKLAAVDVGR